MFIDKINITIDMTRWGRTEFITTSILLRISAGHVFIRGQEARHLEDWTSTLLQVVLHGCQKVRRCAALA